jgi:hypothetical protein
LLQHAFVFRQRRGDDYYSSRLLSHFLLHCGCGLKVAQIARLGQACRCWWACPGARPAARPEPRFTHEFC